mgnify:CR=1 FL=1
MSQKKKLILSPLPEQTDDYSRYEESETRWDRIIALVVILVLLIGVLIYFLVSDDERNVTSVLDTTVSEEQNSDLKPEEINLPVVQGNTIKDDVLTQRTEQKTAVVDAKLDDVPSKETASKPDLEQPMKADLSASVQTEGVVKKTSVTRASNARSAQIKIQNNAITRAVLTLEIKDDEPRGSIPYELALPEEGITKVILFTEMSGLRGKKLYHEWYRNVVRQSRGKIPVNVDKQISYSSKYINVQMLGDWQVKVVDEKQNSYALAEFKVVLP